MLAQDSTFGCYHIRELLGSGAMGDVYRALDTRLDREVALKLIRSELASSDEYRQRLAQEAKAAARVDSPYVVRVWEYSVIDDTPYLSMEYVTGRELLEATRGLDLESRLTVALHIAEGIEAAHSAGLIHGDLKPENIRLSAVNRPKILDFGLAKPVRESTVDDRGQIAGTLHYLTPEQLTGEPASLSSDLFAFGVILYEMMAGKRPFEGDNPASVAYSILHVAPVALREQVPEFPEWLDALILRSLAKHSNDRFGSISEIAEHFRRSLGGRAVTIDREIAGRSKSVTVIDLKNMSGDASWDYFCEGFTDDIIGELSRRTDLVISAQPSQDLPRDMREVFKRFHTDFVISGSLMRYQDSFQLRLGIHTDGGDRLVSSDKFEERADRLFDLLGRAARETSAILERETGVPSLEVEDTPQTDITAYDYYLQGKSYYQTNKPEALEFSRGMFEKALAIDPDFALAHTGLADLFAFQYMAYYDRSEKCMDEARERALRAIEIDPSLPEGHRSLGRYHMFMGAFEKAKACFLKAIELNPKYAIGYRTLAWLKYREGEFEASLEWAEKALLMAPTDTETLLLIGLLHTYGREYTAATVTLQRALEIGPDYGRAYYNLGLVYLKLGVLDPAIENFQAGCKYSGDPNCYIDVGWALFLKNEPDKARRALTKSIENDFFPFVANYTLGFVERKCGHEELAVEHFRKAVQELKDVDYGDKENVQMQGYYALALTGAGDFEAARIQLEEILECDRLIGDVLYNVARCYALLGDTMEARMYLQQALNVSPGPTEKEVALDPHFESIRLK